MILSTFDSKQKEAIFDSIMVITLGNDYRESWTSNDKRWELHTSRLKNSNKRLLKIFKGDNLIFRMYIDYSIIKDLKDVC